MKTYRRIDGAPFYVKECTAWPISANLTFSKDGKTSKYVPGDMVILFEENDDFNFALMKKDAFTTVFAEVTQKVNNDSVARNGSHLAERITSSFSGSKRNSNMQASTSKQATGNRASTERRQPSRTKNEDAENGQAYDGIDDGEPYNIVPEEFDFSPNE